MNIFEYNSVIYKGNVNRDFYFYCLKHNIKLLKYLFINIWNLILSFIFKSKANIYEINKFKYLKDVKKIEDEIKNFYSKDKLNHMIDNRIDIICDKVPDILIKKDLSKKIIGYELDDHFEVNLKKYDEKVDKLKNADNIYLRNKYNLNNINSKKVFIVHNNIMININARRKLNKNRTALLIIIAISLLLTCISFCYTNYLLDMDMIMSYFSLPLFIMNFIPIFLLVTLFSLITKRIHISFVINAILILSLGIANQTKLLYRDDIVKFEDLTILKEAMIMSQRYDAVIRWYTITFIIIIIFTFFILKKYIKKIEYSIKKYIISICAIVGLIFLTYGTIYQNSKIYDRLGDKTLINIWITTRQYQIRGLVYPFVYTIKDVIDTKPDNYDAKKAEKILKNYKYTNIDNDKKVNVIAIMLEAYNDFSKFDTIDFNEDIYEKFHNIESKSINGNIVANIFGGGTINTERSFLTGYNNGPSYRKLTNSYVWYFKEQGYRTEAMHPIYGAFYNRSSVNPNIGFDAYYCYENKFSNIQNAFLEDYDFFDYIIEGYEKSKKDDKPYFNFSVTYQNHGPYNSNDYVNKEYYFDNKGYDIEAYNTINEYFSGIKKTNIALEKLINYFEDEEATIIVLFGDHNPYLGENNLAYNELNINLDLATVEGFENYYETPYIIYGNKAAKEIFNNNFIGKGPTISAIFLMNEVTNQMGIKGNEYLQYMNDLKNNIDVIGINYYKEDNRFVLIEDSKNKELINEYNNVSYYYSRNFKGEIK